MPLALTRCVLRALPRPARPRSALSLASHSARKRRPGPQLLRCASLDAGGRGGALAAERWAWPGACAWCRCLVAAAALIMPLFQFRTPNLPQGWPVAAPNTMACCCSQHDGLLLLPTRWPVAAPNTMACCCSQHDGLLLLSTRWPVAALNTMACC
jgi:hypothetical protein